MVIKSPPAPVNIMMWALCCLGYFAFLRAGVFTSPSTSQPDSEVHLSPADIAVDSHTQPTLMRVHLKSILKQTSNDKGLPCTLEEHSTLYTP